MKIIAPVYEYLDKDRILLPERMETHYDKYKAIVEGYINNLDKGEEIEQEKFKGIVSALEE